MVEKELLIGRLRDQVRNLQSLLNYLENRERVAQEDCSYGHATVSDVIKRLRELEQQFSQSHTVQRLHAEWLN